MQNITRDHERSWRFMVQWIGEGIYNAGSDFEGATSSFEPNLALHSSFACSFAVAEATTTDV